MDKKKIIGITGGLASGKTTVADMLVEKGAAKIDVDKIGHELLAENEDVKQAVIALFGEKILSEGDIDRRKLRKEVFLDREKLENLNRLMHPLMIKRIKDEISRVSEGTLLIDAALLIEMGLNEVADFVVVVTADDTIKIKRAANLGVSEEEAKRIIARQTPVSEKLKFADYSIDNNGDLNTIKKGVNKLWKKIQEL